MSEPCITTTSTTSTTTEPMEVDTVVVVQTNKVKTPDWILAWIRSKIGCDFFDPCPLNWKKGDRDGLEAEWKSPSYCNPPFSHNKKWVEKAFKEWRKGKVIWILIKLDKTTTVRNWFHEYIIPHC